MCYLTRAVQPIYWVPCRCVILQELAVQPIYWVSCRCVILHELYSLFIGCLVDVLSYVSCSLFIECLVDVLSYMSYAAYLLGVL